MADERDRGTSGQPQPEAMMAPGDEAPPGTPGTGEDVCPDCHGSGRIDGRDCDTCLGRGRVIKVISAGP
jgi:RecJ-like exonuclease